MSKNKLIPLIGILLIIGVIGYLYLQKKSSPPLSPEIKKAQQTVMANCKYDPDFCKYAANGIVAMSKGYTMTSESTYNGKSSKMTLNSDGKGNTESVSYSDGKEEGSFISLDKITYTKGPGETVWTQLPQVKDETGTQTTNLFDFEGLKTDLANATKEATDTLVVKKLGSEACGKLTCSVFEMTEKATSATTKIWIDTQEFLARKMEMTTKEGVSTITFEYGAVVIAKPSPVKTMPAIPNGAGANMSPEEIKNLMKNIPQTNQEPPSQETPAE